jgi:hypothetical protein
MYLPPGNIDELLNPPDYVPPVLRGRQIAKLIGQGVSTSAEIYKAQETIAAQNRNLEIKHSAMMTISYLYSTSGTPRAIIKDIKQDGKRQ